MTDLIAYPDFWSYSRWAKWEQCPLAYKLQNIDKIPVAQSPAMARGNNVHTAISHYIEAHTDERPAVAHFGHLFDELRAANGYKREVEQKWAFTEEWRPTGYFSKGGPATRTWLRATLDVNLIYPDNTAEVVDWKTGKRYDSNDDQMELFAVVEWARYPEVEAVTTRLTYLDQGTEEYAQFMAKDKAKLRAKWDARAREMLTDRTFLPKPNDKCRFCDFARSNGGQCRYG